MSISQPEWTGPGGGGMGWWMDGGMVGGGGVCVRSSQPPALLCCHLLPHSRPEVVGVLLTCNPSHCLAAGSRVTCHSLWRESALTPADLSYFSPSVNTAGRRWASTATPTTTKRRRNTHVAHHAAWQNTQSDLIAHENVFRRFSWCNHN